MKYLKFILGLTILASCDESLSPKIGKLTALSTPTGEIFFYRIVSGFSTDGYFLSKKKDPCIPGFKKDEDYYFTVLGQTIYYETKGDTLLIYTSLPAEVPKNFGFNVVQKSLKPLEVHQYEEKYKNDEILKVAIDSMYTPNCEIKF